ncbi:STAS domain-containing protein [Metabacillus sp. GX 13764]|uniref:STAS domain-containing protein n=1 Tax=Metabacillus kandeliae TaxID=2900151 RepID=UPI001E32414F|nr:STAS domain-containing protein [Metabacillus kandeliae]MCD7036155.1 STAS domain-containing protein [Metabacillus kandeliae]
MSINQSAEAKEAVVGGLRFNWNLDEGRFQYEEGDAVLFWIDSAMKSFFDTLEEISGNKAAAVVLETAGFRQGIVVGEYFKSMNLTIDQVAEVLPNTYASAGWGRTSINRICANEYKAVVQIKDSWEYKINKAQGKTTHGTFTPGHFAGIFTGLFGTNVWYRVVKSQILGDKYCEFEYFPSEKSVQQNIHDLARSEESERIRELENVVEDRTRELNDLIKEISSPIIPVLEGIVVVPLVGRYDEERSEALVHKTLVNLPAYKANYLVLDLTGLNKNISENTVEFIDKLAAAASLIGTKTILVGISAEFALHISKSDFKLSSYNCFSTLQHGIYFALSEQGRRLV